MHCTWTGVSFGETQANQREPGTGHGHRVRTAGHRTGVRGAVGVLDVANGLSVLAACDDLVAVDVPERRADLPADRAAGREGARGAAASSVAAVAAAGAAFSGAPDPRVRNVFRRRIRLGFQLAALRACARRDQRLARGRAGAVCGRHVDLQAARAVAHQHRGAALRHRPLCDLARLCVAYGRRLGRKPQARPVRRARTVGQVARRTGKRRAIDDPPRTCHGARRPSRARERRGAARCVRAPAEGRTAVGFAGRGGGTIARRYSVRRSRARATATPRALDATLRQF